MSFDFKQYLNSLNVKKFRVALTQFRTSSHRLEVETGRWQKPTLFHITKGYDSSISYSNVNFWNIYVKKYLTQYFYNRINMFTIDEFMCSENEKKSENY